jgi:hypothetical protein
MRSKIDEQRDQGDNDKTSGSYNGEYEEHGWD